MTIENDAIGYAPDHPAVLASLEAMALGRRSWEAKRDECYAWLRMREALDPDALSNVGRRNIYWSSSKSRCGYAIKLMGPWGLKAMWIAAPSSLEEAKKDPLLEKAVAKRDATYKALVKEHGEPRQLARGFYPQIEAVLQATEEGRRFLEGVTLRWQVQNIAQLASVANAYRPEQWNRRNARTVHRVFYAQPDRVQLVNEKTWGTEEAKRELASRTSSAKPDPFRPVTPVRAHTRGLQLSEDLKLELGLAYEMGITIDDVLAFWNDLASTDDRGEAVAA